MNFILKSQCSLHILTGIWVLLTLNAGQNILAYMSCMLSVKKKEKEGKIKQNEANTCIGAGGLHPNAS